MPVGGYQKFMLTLLSRVAAAGGSERFSLREVCPKDATRYENALDNLCDAGLAECVREGCGRWFYRLTETGVKAAAAGKIPRAKPPEGVRADDCERRAEFGWPSGERRRRTPGNYRE